MSSECWIQALQPVLQEVGVTVRGVRTLVDSVMLLLTAEDGALWTRLIRGYLYAEGDGGQEHGRGVVFGTRYFTVGDRFGFAYTMEIPQVLGAPDCAVVQQVAAVLKDVIANEEEKRRRADEWFWEHMEGRP